MMSVMMSGLLLATAAAAEARHPAAEIAAAERAFAAHSVAEGLNAAFAAHFADHAVDFAPAPRPDARQYYVDQPEPPVTLDWYPAYTLAAASGDFGLSTGPFTLTANDGGRPPAHGQYISVWQLQPDGEWKVLIDGGVSHRAPEQAAPPLDPAAMPANQLAAPAAWAGAPVEVLLDADAALSRVSRSEGIQAAFTARGHETLRFYRDGQWPQIGKAAALKALAGLPGVWTWQPQGGGIAASGDLGYTYGVSTRVTEAGEERGAYLRVWQRDGSGWKVVLTRDNPLPPAT